MDLKYEYCRLCATLFPHEKLINLKTDSRKRDDVVKKLIHVNAKVDFHHNIMPRTVCITCDSSLDAAYQFVSAIDQAQPTLAGLLQKKDSTVSDADNLNYEFKQEVCIIKIEPDDSQDEAENGNIPVFKITSEEKHLSNITTTQVQPISTSTVQNDIKVTREIDSDDELPEPESSAATSGPEGTWKGYNWICSICETQFTSFKELNAHSVQYHYLCNAYKCCDCGQRRFTIKLFLKHVKRHRPHLRECCYICHKDFKDAFLLRTHVAAHLKADYKCDGCNATFADKDEHSKHCETLFKTWNVGNGKPKDSLTCVTCYKTYKNRTSFTNHLKTHESRKKDHTCEICGKCFYSSYNLQEHIAVHNDTKPFKCEICKLECRSENRLRAHVKIQHGDDNRFVCDECGKGFRYKKNLTSHHRVHTKEKPFVCEHCNKAFRFKNLLTKHVRLHTGEKPYSCTECKHDFTNWSNYNKHMKRRHNIDTSKTKRTRNGVLRINPETREIEVPNELPELQQWKETLLQRGRQVDGQGKTNAKQGKDYKKIDSNIGEVIAVEMEEIGPA